MDTKKAKFLEVLKNNAGLIYISCEKYNIDPTTFYNWKKTDPQFEKAVENITERLIDLGESTLYTKMKEGDLTATIFFLKTKGKHRGYSEKQYNEITLRKDLRIDKLDDDAIALAEKLFNKIND
jgi:hypothetical protein